MQYVRVFFFRFFFIVLALSFGLAHAGDHRPADKTKSNEHFDISGPYAHQNLAVYLIHGKDQLEGKKVIALHKALDEKLITIHETGDVNRLTAENRSNDRYVFIQSGDIVKGGRQDRTLGQDLLLPPKSGKIAIEAFCVEQGRWRKRGQEKAGTFASSEKYLSSKALKIAAKSAKSQAEVWRAVSEAQDHLSQKVGKSVRSSQSESSLQLSLEDKTVKEKSDQYFQSLQPIPGKENNVIGFAYAVNGEFSTAEIYGNSDLFQQLWPKQLEAAACEAMAQDAIGAKWSAPDISSVKASLLETMRTDKGVVSSHHYTRRRAGESKKNLVFETRDDQGQMIHMNIIGR